MKRLTVCAAVLMAAAFGTTALAQKTTELKTGGGGSPHVKTDWTIDKADISIALSGGAGFRRLSGSAELLKNVNTDALEYAACVSPDELELFFTRAGKGGPAIYRSTRKNATQAFDSPARVAAIKGFVEAPALSPDGRSLYYHLKEGERFVIYRVTRAQ